MKTKKVLAKRSRRLSKAEQDGLFRRAEVAEDAGDHSLAFRLLMRGAKAGHTWAMMSLANCYTKGTGVKQNLQRALEWDLRAYSKGETSNAFNIAIDYRFLCRYEEHVQWLERASSNGDVDANIELALVHWREDNPMKARDYARKALRAKLNRDASQLDLEMAYWLLYGLESVGKRATKAHPVFKNYRP